MHLAGQCHHRDKEFLQKVQIHRKADGAGFPAHSLHQSVVLSAGEDRRGDTPHKAFENDAVVIVHILHYGEIQADPRLTQDGKNIPQLPPFLLGLNWSTTERMSTQQADLLTSELWALRRTVEPVVRKICKTYLALEGLDDRVDIEWNDISLQDITEEARAQLYAAQAEKYRAEAKI